MGRFARAMDRQQQARLKSAAGLCAVRATLEEHAGELVQRARAKPSLDIAELVRGQHGTRVVLLGWTVHLSTGSCGPSRHWHLTARLTLPGKRDAVLEANEAWLRLGPIVSTIADSTDRGRSGIVDMSVAESSIQRYCWHSDRRSSYCKVHDDFVAALEISETARTRPAQRADDNETERARSLLERMLAKNLARQGNR